MKLKYIALFTILLLLSCTEDDSIESVNDPVENDTSEEPVDNLTTKPNILFIIADDMGLDATPGYSVGSIKPNMPNLTSLMNNGIRYTNAWSNPTCTPTRATILTGKYGFRTNVTKVDDVLSTSETSIQKYLKQNGASSYNCAVIGKWHLSMNKLHPNNMDIDYFAGLIGGGVGSYTNWNLIINGEETNSTAYTTSKFTDLAIDWVGNQTEPWFLWLAYNAPHTPFHLPPDHLHTQGNLPDDEASIDANPLPYYLAMIEAMDTEIGRLLESMSSEERENTIIIFIGDNGTPNQVVQEYASNRAKGSVFQGGVNVPLIVSGKNVTRYGATDSRLINASDLFATIATVSGAEVSQINDSFDFSHSFSNATEESRTHIFAQNGKDTGGSDVTIRNNQYKYLKLDNGNELFFDLEANPMEFPNLLNGTLTNDEEIAYNELKRELTALLD